MVQTTPEVNTCPPEHKHDESTTCYVHHRCRCLPCSAAQKRRMRQYRRLKGQPTLLPDRAVRRRVQALQALGWSLGELSRKLGKHESYLPTLMQREQMREPRVVAAVDRLYRELYKRRPPLDTPRQKQNYTKAIRVAVARGYVPPAGWDDIDRDPEPPAVESTAPAKFDHAVVELAVMGHKPTLTPDEREEVVRRLHGRRWSDTTIGNFIGSNGETILRIRQRLGLTAWTKAELLWHEKDAA